MVRARETPSIGQLRQTPQLVPGSASSSVTKKEGEIPFLQPRLCCQWCHKPAWHHRGCGFPRLTQPPVAKAFSEHACREWGPSVHPIRVQQVLRKLLLSCLCSEQGGHKVPGSASLLLWLVPLISSKRYLFSR